MDRRPQHRHLARGTARARVAAVAVSRQLPHRQRDPVWIALHRRGRLRGGLAGAGRPQPLPGRDRPGLPPSLRDGAATGPSSSRARWASTAWSTSWATTRSQQGWALPAPGAAQGKRVAVVGGGPAGLSARTTCGSSATTSPCSRLGRDWAVCCVWGIPEYRLPGDVVDREIERIVDLGVEVRTDAPVADEAALARLRQEYDAVFVAVGAAARQAAGASGRGRRFGPRARRAGLPAPGERRARTSSSGSAWWSSAAAARPSTWPAPPGGRART